MGSNASDEGHDLLGHFRIREDHLEMRRQFLGIDSDDRDMIAGLLPWARKVAGIVTREFYDRQVSFAPTRAFLEGVANEAGLPLESLRVSLEESQARYWVQIFEGAESNWGSSYYQGRLAIGHVHDRIDLPVKWYLGSYASLFSIVQKHLARAVRGSRRAKAEESILKVLHYDMLAVMESYTLCLLQSLGVRIDGVDAVAGHDLTESVGEIKACVKDLRNSIAECVATLKTAGEELRLVSKELDTCASAVATETEALSESISEIASNSVRASEIARAVVERSQAAAESMDQLDRNNSSVSEVVQLIRMLSGQTNLLALNATIEASRAGESGKGFAVVAGEVKELAGRAARATNEVSGNVRGIHESSLSVHRAVTEVTRVAQQMDELESAVAAAVQQQGVAIFGIRQNARSASTAAQSTRTAATALTEAAERLAGLVDHT